MMMMMIKRSKFALAEAPPVPRVDLLRGYKKKLE